MKHYASILLLLLPHALISMRPEKSERQLEVASGRRAYHQHANNKRAQGFCFFCDEDTLKQNFITSTDNDRDVRVMMNKIPYFPFDQGQHLLIMPLSHEENPDKISYQQMQSQCWEVQKLSAAFHEDAYHQEFFSNWGPGAGQSVAHWHSQFKNYVQEPLSLPDYIKARKNQRITTIEEAFSTTTARLSSFTFEPTTNEFVTSISSCLCCSIGTYDQDAQDANDVYNHNTQNLVVAHFKHNYVCMSHHPEVPGELCVIPYHHVCCVKDLPLPTFVENMVIAMALLPKVKEYTQEHIRECTGANLHTKSIGAKAPQKDQDTHHVYTRIMARTTIAATPGTLIGDSCKLDMDPLHFYQYAKGAVDEIKKKLR